MIAILSLLIVVVLSLLVVRIATVALTLTGISRELARFQARSAFTGAGFTTQESEQVVQHPVRRRVIMMLLLLGNAGIITAASSLILSFADLQGSATSAKDVALRTLLLLGGLAAIWALAHSRWVDQSVSNWIEKALQRWTDLEVRDYQALLHLSNQYAVAELLVEPEDWLANRTLQQLRLSEEGILVLGIERPHKPFVGAPRGHTELKSGDTLIIYGPRERLKELDERDARGGNWRHVEAVVRQKQIERQAEDEEEQSSSEATDVATSRSEAEHQQSSGKSAAEAGNGQQIEDANARRTEMQPAASPESGA